MIIDIGYDSADNSYLDGKVSLAFLCAAACTDAQIGALYQQQRALFGV